MLKMNDMQWRPRITTKRFNRSGCGRNSPYQHYQCAKCGGVQWACHFNRQSMGMGCDNQTKAKVPQCAQKLLANVAGYEESQKLRSCLQHK